MTLDSYVNSDTCESLEVGNSNSSSYVSLYSRFCHELYPFQPSFSVLDAPTGCNIDIPASFAPSGFLVNVWKALAVVLGICNVGFGFAATAEPAFYFAYLTNWGALACTFYLIFSLFNSVCSEKVQQPETKINLQIRFTWLLFIVGLHTTTLCTIMFWLLVFDPDNDISFTMVFSHGGYIPLLLIDGMIINRIPIRLPQWFSLVLPFDLVALLWTLAHAMIGIGNPDNNDNDPETNDDVLYPGSLEWNDNWKQALFWSLITIFILGPLIFLLYWSLSSNCGSDRRHYQKPLS